MARHSGTGGFMNMQRSEGSLADDPANGSAGSFAAGSSAIFTLSDMAGMRRRTAHRPLSLMAAAILVLAAMVRVDGPAVAGGKTREKLYDESRSVGAFDRLSLHGGANVKLRIGEPVSVVVRARRAEDLSRVETRVVGGRLVVDTHFHKDSGRHGRGVEVSIVVPHLREAAITGAADLAIAGLEEKAFSLLVSGAGDATLSGRCEHLEVAVSGAGDVRADDLACRDIRLKVSGSGDVGIPAGEELTARISGAGDLRLSGPCGDLKLEVSGAGDVDGRDVRCRRADLRLRGVGDVKVGVDGPVSVRQSGVGDVTLFGDPQVRLLERSGVGDFRIRRSPPSR